jgi:hypothetical protein
LEMIENVIEGRMRIRGVALKEENKKRKLCEGGIFNTNSEVSRPTMVNSVSLYGYLWTLF